MTAKEKFDRFFTALTDRINALNPVIVSQTPFELQNYTPETQAKLTLYALHLLDAVGAHVPDKGARCIVADQLSTWLSKERPDLVYKMLYNS